MNNAGNNFSQNEFKRKARSSELDGLVRLDVLDGGMDHDIGSVSGLQWLLYCNSVCIDSLT